MFYDLMELPDKTTLVRYTARPMQQVCTACGQSFVFSDDDRKLLAKLTPEFDGRPFAIPVPELCFECRLQRRLAFYNCRSLYKRTCDHTGAPIVSLYSPDKPFTVYCKESWWSDDAWDPLDYGREFDFNRSFFEQFQEFMENTPLVALNLLGENVNSDYSNDNWKLKNCYMVFDGEQAEDCYYGHSFVGIRSSVDFTFLTNSELCFECVHCDRCYGLRYSQYSKNCNDSWFLRDCIGCTNCFGCANLRQREYCIFNEQKTKEEYEAFMDQFDSTSSSAVSSMKKKAEEFFLSQPVRATRGERTLSSTGDNLDDSKDCHMCFDCLGMQDARYCTDCMMGAKDCMDVHIWGDGMELSYNCSVGGASSRRLMCNYYVFESADEVYYSFFCTRNCKKLFSCIGLRHKEHCIFNKQYSPEEYEKLAARIAEHMQKTGEWGQFFPAEISAFGYNETMAQSFYPLSKEDVIAKGWQWSDYEMPVEADRTIQASQLPDSINDIPDDVLNWAIQCEVTGKPYKLTKQELEFYRTHSLPIPRRHPNQRHADRFTYKNPYKLWKRTCAKSSKEILTSYAPDRPEIVYDNDVYKEEVYGTERVS